MPTASRCLSGYCINLALLLTKPLVEDVFPKNGTATDLVSLVPPIKGKSLLFLLFHLHGTLWLLIGENRQNPFWKSLGDFQISAIRSNGASACLSLRTCPGSSAPYCGKPRAPGGILAGSRLPPRERRVSERLCR